MNPPKPVDPSLVEKLASIMCTDDEIAKIVKMSESSLKRRFRQQLSDGRAAGKMSLRRAQFESATKHNNVVAQIWLGKQVLGQRDKMETTINTGNADSRLSRMTDAELDAEISRLESTRSGALVGVEDRASPPQDAAVPQIRLLASGE